MGGEKGFTLVETLVSLTLLALVATLLFGGLRFGAKSWDAVATRAESRSDAGAVRGFLSARLAHLSAPQGAVAGIEGAGEALRFTAPWTGGPVPPGLYQFALRREGDDLTLTWRPAAGDDDLAGRRTLLSGVDTLSLSYYGGGDGEPARWRRDWPAALGAPNLVRVDLAFADPARTWAPLVIRRGL